MADVDSTLFSWSTTRASNKPAGSTTVGTGWDDNLREIQGVTRGWLASKGADIASAATTDIGAVEGLFHDITGTTTITSFGTVSSGIWKVLKFEGVLTLTHNATSLITLIGASRTTADGDVGIYISEGSGNWRELSYFYAGGLLMDTHPVVIGSADRTKKVRLEVDGLTTATTRTITVPDADFTLNSCGTIASGKNIAARTNSGTPNTKFDMTADEVILKDTNNNIFVARSVNVTVDFAGTGANGIDASTQQASTWYYGWVIAKPDGTIAGLGSASATAPTMPSGYTYKALVTAARSDGSVHFIKYRQQGNEIFYETPQNVLSGGTASSETAITITAQVPPPAIGFRVNYYGNGTTSGGGTGNANAFLRVITTIDYAQVSFAAAASGAFGFGSEFTLPNLSQTLFYLFAPTTNIATISIGVNIIAFKLPMGGE